MAKEKDKHITVTANDQHRTIKLENPNLKIISKQGEQISVHSFFELFSTLDRTKKIKKQLDKEISMLKNLKISFQKKLNKFKTAKLFSIRKLKERETFLMKHYDEIVTKMKNKAQEEISLQFSTFKKDIAEEKNKLVSEIITESDKYSRNLKSAEENLKEQFSKFEKTLKETKTNTIETVSSLKEDVISQFANFKQNVLEENEKISKEIHKLTTNSLSSINAENDKISTKINSFEKIKTDTIQEIVTTSKEVFGQLSDFKQYITQTQTTTIKELEKAKTETVKTIESIRENTLLDVESKNKLITDKLQSLNSTVESLQEKMLKELEETKNKALLEVEDAGTTKENFRKFTKISQDYIKNSISTALAEIEVVKDTLSSEITELSAISKKEIDSFKQDTEEDLKSISIQAKQESSENLKTILENIEEFSNKTKLEIADLTSKFEAEQNTMLKNTYRDLQVLQEKLQEIDKTEEIKMIHDEFQKLKKQNELTLENIKSNTNQALTKSLEELLTKAQGIKSSNKEELQLIKDQISEHEQMFYEKVQEKLDELLEISQTENEKQMKVTSDIINELKQETEQEVAQIKQELHEEKLQLVETISEDLNHLKGELHQKAEIQLAETTGLLEGFKQSFEKSQKELLAQNKEQLLKLEQEANLKMQEQLSSAKTYIEEIKNDSIRNIHDITKDVENEQKVLNKLIVQVKGIKTTLETGVFADLESTINNIESIKQTHALQMDNLKKENQKTQQETIRQLKISTEEAIEANLQKAVDKIIVLQEQLKNEKSQLTESAIKLNKLQSQTQQELYEQLEQTLSNVNSIKEEAESSVKQLKNESFTEILNIKKSLHQVIGYLKKQKAETEKKLFGPTTIISKKETTNQDELISMLLKEDLNL